MGVVCFKKTHWGSARRNQQRGGKGPGKPQGAHRAELWCASQPSPHQKASTPQQGPDVSSTPLPGPLPSPVLASQVVPLLLPVEAAFSFCSFSVGKKTLATLGQLFLPTPPCVCLRGSNQVCCFRETTRPWGLLLSAQVSKEDGRPWGRPCPSPGFRDAEGGSDLALACGPVSVQGGVPVWLLAGSWPVLPLFSRL